MKRLFLAVVLASASIAGVAWSVPPVTVIEDVVVGSVVDDDVFLLQDGRRLVLNRPIDKPEALVGRSIRVIARVDPQIAGQKALFADILRIREAPGVSFSKDGEEVDIEGTVTELGSSSFGLSTALGIFQVVIDEDTEFHDLEGIAGLAVGDLVRVKGELEGAVILADEVRALEEEDDDDNPSGVIFESLGQITSLPESDHIALDDSRTYISDDQTSYSDGLHAYDDLIVGMMIEIKALRDTSGINRALEVKMQSDGAGVTEFEGQIQNVDLAGFDYPA